MMRLSAAAAALAIVVAVPALVEAYDFAERPVAVVPGTAPQGIAAGGTAYGDTAYHANVFASTDIDRFQVRNYLLHGIVDVAPARLSAYYATAMLNGPVNSGDQPGADAAQWMMNAVQFEYGFVASVDLPTSRSTARRLAVDRIALLAEYSRRSYHPLRSGFEDPAADIVRGGVAVRGLRLTDAIDLDAMVRLTWSELYEFWGAPRIPDPRALFTLNTAVEVTANLPVTGLSAFAVVLPDTILLRDRGVSMDFTGQTGVHAGSGGASVEVFLDLYRSADTEQLPNLRSPALLAGYGIRFRVDV